VPESHMGFWRGWSRRKNVWNALASGMLSHCCPTKSCTITGCRAQSPTTSTHRLRFIGSLRVYKRRAGRRAATREAHSRQVGLPHTLDEPSKRPAPKREGTWLSEAGLRAPNKPSTEVKPTTVSTGDFTDVLGGLRLPRGVRSVVLGGPDAAERVSSTV
jgi:hypothetical protein